MAQETTVAVKINAQTGGTESVKSLKAQIREAVNEATLLAQKFGEFSPEAQAAAARVAQLKENMQEFNERVQALSPEKFSRINTIASGIASGFSAAQGAMALFGAESEDLQKSLLKVQGAMALAQGIEGLDKAGNQLSALGAKGLEAFNKMTTASKAFVATGIGLILTAVALVVANFDKLGEAFGFVESEITKANRAMTQAGAIAKTQAQSLDYYNSIVQDTTKSEGERKFALEELKKAGIDTDDVNIANANSLATLSDRIREQIPLIEKRARVEAIAKIMAEKQEEIIKNTTGTLGDALSTWDKFMIGFTSGMVTPAQLTEKMQKKATENVKKTQSDLSAITKLYATELSELTALEGKRTTQHEKYTSTLKLRTEAEKDAEQAAKDAAAQQEELQKRSQELLAEAALVGLTEVQQAKVMALRKFKANTEGFQEGSAEYLAAQKIFNAEIDKINKEQTEKEKAELEARKAAREKFVEDAKAITQKEIADTIAATDKLYANKKNQLTLQGAAQSEFDNLEIQRLEAQLQNAKDYGELTKDETLRIEAELATKRKEIRDKDVADAKAAEEAKRQMQMDTLGSISSALGSLADLAGENEKAQKAFALAQIATDTAIALSNASASAFSPASPDNALTGGLAGVAKYASFVAIILSNAARARQILKGGGAGGAGGNAPATANAPQTTPLTGGTLPDTEAGQFAGMGKVYVLEGDITKTQTRVRRVRNVSVV